MNWNPVLINILLTVHIIVSILIVLVVLMQRPKNEGLGAAFGGGVTDNLFGSQTTNVLANFTRWLGALFFGLTLLLSWLYVRKSTDTTKSPLQQRLISAPAVVPVVPVVPPTPPTPLEAGAPAVPAVDAAGNPVAPGPDAPGTPASDPAMQTLPTTPEAASAPVPVPSPAPAASAPPETPPAPAVPVLPSAGAPAPAPVPAAQ